MEGTGREKKKKDSREEPTTDVRDTEDWIEPPF